MFSTDNQSFSQYLPNIALIVNAGHSSMLNIAPMVNAEFAQKVKAAYSSDSQS